MSFRAYSRGGCGLAKTLFSYQIANHLPTARRALVQAFERKASGDQDLLKTTLAAGGFACAPTFSLTFALESAVGPVLIRCTH